MNVVVVESPTKASTHRQVPGARLQGRGLLRARSRPPAQGRLGAAGRCLRHGLDRRRRCREAHRRHPQGAPGARTISISPPTRTARARRSHGTCGTSSAGAGCWTVSRSSAWSSPRSTKSAVLDAMAAPPRPRRQPDRRLQGAPRARLSGGLHALTGALAQASRLALGRPRAIGRAPPDLRART